MPDCNEGDQRDLPAGNFSAWLGEIRGAIAGEGGADVPCAGCTACCTSSQFVHIAPDETDTLRHIPRELLFPAPRLPRGHVVLGYDERGHCPMLIDNQCSIYEHRPQACRSYDCRVFPAAGLSADEDKILIGKRARRWRFSFPERTDQTDHDVVRAAAAFLDGHRDVLPDAAVRTNATQLAVLAIEVHGVFLARDEQTGETIVIEPDVEVVRAEVRSRTGARRAS